VPDAGELGFFGRAAAVRGYLAVMLKAPLRLVDVVADRRRFRCFRLGAAPVLRLRLRRPGEVVGG
jgi:hypothetical protein